MSYYIEVDVANNLDLINVTLLIKCSKRHLHNIVGNDMQMFIMTS